MWTSINRAKLLAAIAQRLPVEERQSVLNEAFGAAADDPEAIAEVALTLTPKEAIIATLGVRRDGTRVFAPKVLAERLPVDHALAAARLIGSEPLRSQALAEVVRRLPAKRALEVTHDINDGETRARALAQMTPRLPAEQALPIARSIDVELWRAEANHIGHKLAQQGLFDGRDPKSIDVSSGITAKNMVGNYQTISVYIDTKLGDKLVFETFVFYFLNRLVLINLNVEQTDVSMVFEVINDRGVRLRPYEILKGKLLGQIDKDELDAGGYNELWERIAAKINAFREDELDNFFRFYLKSKFSKTRKDGQRFDGDYHRAMFAADMDSSLGLQRSPKSVKTFLNGTFTYYATLYVKLRKATRQTRNLCARFISMRCSIWTRRSTWQARRAL
jgi:hypothetical protein